MSWLLRGQLRASVAHSLSSRQRGNDARQHAAETGAHALHVFLDADEKTFQLARLPLRHMQIERDRRRTPHFLLGCAFPVWALTWVSSCISEVKLTLNVKAKKLPTNPYRLLRHRYLSFLPPIRQMG